MELRAERVGRKPRGWPGTAAQVFPASELRKMLAFRVETAA